MKVWIYTYDPILTLLYLPDEARELFGEGYIDDAVDVPDDLANELSLTYKKLRYLSQELDKYRG